MHYSCVDVSQTVQRIAINYTANINSDTVSKSLSEIQILNGRF